MLAVGRLYMGARLNQLDPRCAIQRCNNDVGLQYLFTVTVRKRELYLTGRPRILSICTFSFICAYGISVVILRPLRDVLAPADGRLGAAARVTLSTTQT